MFYHGLTLPDAACHNGRDAGAQRRTFPIQVLTRPDPAWLPRSDGIECVQGGMAVDRDTHFQVETVLYNRAQTGSEGTGNLHEQVSQTL